MPAYFISNLGDDSKDGLTEVTAWKTIAKVNGFHFLPDDVVKFGCGNSWIGTMLRLSYGGSAGNPVIIDCYGLGALPIISAVVGSTTRAIYFGMPFITMQNINAKNGANTSVEIGNTHDIVIRNCTVSGDATLLANGISIWGGCYNITLDGCKVSGAKVMSGGGGGIYAADCINLTVVNCSIDHCGTSTTFDHGIYIHTSSDSHIYGNITVFNAATGITSNGCINTIFEQNLSTDNSIGFQMSGNYGPVVNEIWRRNCAVNNTFNFAVNPNATTTTGLIQNNTLINAKSKGLFFFGVAAINVSKNIIVQDAAIVGEQWSASPVFFSTTLAANAALFDGNLLLYKNALSTRIVGTQDNSSSYTWTQWLLHDPHGLNVDPQFVTNYSDLHLKTGSPAVGLGAYGGVMSTTVNMTGISSGNVPATPVTVTAVASIPALFASVVVNYTDPAPTGSVVLTAVPDANGDSDVTVTVDNHQSKNNLLQRIFKCHVRKVNPPTLDVIADITINS